MKRKKSFQTMDIIIIIYLSSAKSDRCTDAHSTCNTAVEIMLDQTETSVHTV